MVALLVLARRHPVLVAVLVVLFPVPAQPARARAITRSVRRPRLVRVRQPDPVARAPATIRSAAAPVWAEAPVCPVRRAPIRALCVVRAPVAPALPAVRLDPELVQVVVPEVRVDPVDFPADVVEAQAVPVDLAAQEDLAARVDPVVRVDLVVRADAGASATAPAAAATPRVLLVSPGVVLRAAASPSAPSVKSSTTWKLPRSAAFGSRAVAARPFACRVALR